MRTIIAGLLAMLVSGCAVIRSEVTVFHDLPLTKVSLKYASIPLKGQEGSLEHRSYENAVKAELNKRGFVETSVAEADVHVFLYYEINTGREVVSSYPIYGQTGSSRSTTTTYPGIAGLPPYSVTTYTPPTHGVVGTGTTSRTIYTSFLFVDFVDPTGFANGRVKKRFEAKVISVGPTGAIARVMPAMIKALFEDFPGKSGSTRRVEAPIE